MNRHAPFAIPCMFGLVSIVVGSLAYCLTQLHQDPVCPEGYACVQLSHKAMMVVPPQPTCGPYQMPTLPEMPDPATLVIPQGASDIEVVTLLLKWVDDGLAMDKSMRGHLMQHYQDYLATCAQSVERVTTTVPEGPTP